jgi:hypothetical protein
MSSVTVSSTTPTLVAAGVEGTASNPYQYSLRFAEGETGIIYLAYAFNDVDAVEKCTSVDGWPWPDTEVVAGTLIAGQKLYGLAKTSDTEIRTLDVAP